MRLVSASRQQPIDRDFSRLPDPMTSRHRLHIILRVPVRVVDDDCVGRDQIDADAARSCGEEHDAHGTLTLLRELVYLFLPVSARDATVHSTVGVFR